jgi:putative membrane protein
MMDLAKKFLSETEKENIVAAVKIAEGKSSGEIVPLVVSASYTYPMADVTGAAALAFLPAVLLTPVMGGFFWIGPQNMWVFMGLFACFFWLFHEIVKRVAWLKRIFISKKEIEQEVKAAAVTRFFGEGLYRTRDETGILLYISVLEQKVWVLADRGINAQVPQSRWDGVVAGIISGIKEKRQGAAICDAVLETGDLLGAHFPKKKDDINELPDLIVSE